MDNNAPQFVFGEVRIPVKPDLSEFRREFDALIAEMKDKIESVPATPSKDAGASSPNGGEALTRGIEQLIGRITREAQPGKAGEATSSLSRTELILTNILREVQAVNERLDTIEAILDDANRIAN